MNELLRLLLSLSLSASVVMALIFATGKIFKKPLDHAWHYYIWLVVIVRLLVPYAPETNLIDLIVQRNQQPVTAESVIQTPRTENTPFILPKQETPEANTDVTNEKALVRKIDNTGHLLTVWAVVAVSMLILKILGFLRFARFSARGRKRIENPDVLDIYQSVVRFLKLRRAPHLYRSRIAGVPMLIGLFRPYILIPDSQIDEQSLRHILLHELTHYKRRDGLYKWLVQIAVCIHWFNPLVYLMANEIDKACELSCDEAVLRRLSRSERRSYGEMLVTSLQYSIESPGRVMILPLSKDGRLMKTRLNAIIGFKRIGMGGIIISLLLTICIGVGAVFAGAYTDKNTVEDRPPEINTADNEEVPTPRIDEPNSQISLSTAADTDEFVKLWTGTIPKKEYEEQIKQREEMDSWLEGLDRDIYSDYYYSSPKMVLQITDVAAFRESPAMKEAEEKGWVFELEEVHLSSNEIDALITKVQFWDRRDELQIIVVGASQDKSTMSIGTTSLSTQNRAIIEEYVGIGSLEFYNPEIANEIAGTGEYRMQGTDGIIDWYVPRLFDKPFVYSVLVNGPSIGALTYGDKPDWNFYLQYDSATTDEQMAEQIEYKLMEWYDTRYDANAISYTIELVPVERIR
jgi:beta-lactamase regulating signal transducer with metallopeptidase domain